MSSTCNTLDKIEKAKYPVVCLPFNGVFVWCKLKELTQVEAMSCGDFSLISTIGDKIRGKKPKIVDVLKFSEIQHNIAEESLVEPTYKEIMERLGKNSNLDEKRKVLQEALIRLRSVKGKERKVLEDQIQQLKIKINLILPNDFLASITAYAMGVNKSDILKVSEDMLLQAAILAEKGNNNPSDHLEGSFTAFMKSDINKRAWFVLKEFKESNKK